MSGKRTLRIKHCTICGKKFETNNPAKYCCGPECRSHLVAGRTLRPIKHVVTATQSEAIRKLYQAAPVERGAVKSLAERLDLPRWKVSRHARDRGWVAKTKKQPDWAEKEIDLLTRNAHLSPEMISRRLRRRGFKRSATAILIKRKRLRLLSNLDGMSASELALCMGVDCKTITRAIRMGKIKAVRRGTNRVASQGGDEWWIKPKSAREYVIEYLSEIDFRKIDKWWVTDLLTGRGYEGVLRPGG